jgi:2-polyprenyl-3-methyl-5-hydroxy-6-metoxy-1,4-benzoquinol methylase
MKQTKAVSEYFTHQADLYLKQDTHPLWNWLKNRETRSFQKLLAGRSFCSVLDVGCGQGHYTRIMAESGAQEIYAIDVAPGMGKAHALPPHTHFEMASIDSFIPKTHFDLVAMMGCWEFFENPLANLARAASWLTPQGEMILSCPKDNFLSALYRQRYATKGITLNRCGLQEIQQWCQVQNRSLSIEAGSSLCWVMRIHR